MDDPQQVMALVAAAARGDLDGVRGMLEPTPTGLQVRGPCGRGLLTHAVRSGNAVLVEWLLSRGADPTWREVDAPRGSALYEAAKAGRRDLVELLLRHGADPNAHVTASGNAVYAAACFPDVRALLEAHGGTLDPYDLVWLDEDDEVMRRVVADPASADAGCGGVYTAVVTRGKRDLLSRLLDAGVRAPPTPCGCRSYLLEDPELLGLLLERGALDPDYPDEHGATLLHVLARPDGDESDSHRAACAARLLAAGADAQARDASGQTPVDLARRHAWTELSAVLDGATNKPPAKP